MRGFRIINNFFSNEKYGQRVIACTASGTIIGAVGGVVESSMNYKKKDMIPLALSGSLIGAASGFFIGFLSPILIPGAIIGGIPHLFYKVTQKEE